MIAEIILKHKRLPYLKAKDLLQEAYDQVYGIFDYGAQAMREKQSRAPHVKRPLASVALHYPEDSAGTSHLYYTIKKFGEYKVGERFHISLNEFLALPHEYAELLLKESETAALRADRITQNAVSDLSQAANSSQR